MLRRKALFVRSCARCQLLPTADVDRAMTLRNGRTRGGDQAPSPDVVRRHALTLIPCRDCAAAIETCGVKAFATSNEGRSPVMRRLRWRSIESLAASAALVVLGVVWLGVFASGGGFLRGSGEGQGIHQARGQFLFCVGGEMKVTWEPDRAKPVDQ
jgi:hypothetical protein